MLAKLKIAIVLLLIGAFSGGVIYVTNEITAPYIESNELSRTIDFYSEIFGVEDPNTLTYLTCVTELVEEDDFLCPSEVTETLIFVDDVLVGKVYEGNDTNSYGKISVLVGVTVDGDIANVIINSSTNTPNFVKRVEKFYIGNFNQYTVDNVKFDSKTGASYTYGSVVKIVNEAIDAYNEGSEE